MAFCSKCGTQLNDEAKFCPKCGHKVESINKESDNMSKSFKRGCNKTNLSDEINESTTNNNNEGGLSVMQKIALWVAILLAAFGLLGGLAIEVWMITIISLCALAALCAVFGGLIEKKYASSTILCAIISVLFAIGALTPTDDQQSRIEKMQSEKPEAKIQASEQKEKQEEANNNTITGTYEVTDKLGCTIHITLNKDKTATITGVRGENITYYCSWDDLTSINKGIRIDFSDEKPYLVYEGGADEIAALSLYLKDGWLYKGRDNVEAKNPKWRLKATKLK